LINGAGNQPALDGGGTFASPEFSPKMNKFWISLAGIAVLGFAWLALPRASPPHLANPSAAHASSKPPPLATAHAMAIPPRRAELDPARQLAAFDAGDQSLRRALEAWTQQSPSDAIAWASALTDAKKRQDALEIVCFALAQRDPRRAVDTAIATRLCDTDAGALSNLTAQWASRDFAAAHDWVLLQEAGNWRDELVARVAFAGSQTNPDAAARIVVEEMAPGPTQTEAAISVLHQWALRDLDAASAWASNFPAAIHARALAEIEGIRLSRQAATGGK
jgi:hypothetical protein